MEEVFANCQKKIKIPSYLFVRTNLLDIKKTHRKKYFSELISHAHIIYIYMQIT